MGECRTQGVTRCVTRVLLISSSVVRGNIRSVEEDENLRAAVIKVTATRVFRQKYALFTGVGRLTRRGDIRTFQQCGVRPGPGSFPLHRPRPFWRGVAGAAHRATRTSCKHT